APPRRPAAGESQAQPLAYGPPPRAGIGQTLLNFCVAAVAEQLACVIWAPEVAVAAFMHLPSPLVHRLVVELYVQCWTARLLHGSTTSLVPFAVEYPEGVRQAPVE